MGSDVLLVFARFPIPGRTKTRLIPGLGAQGAADYYRELAEWSIRQARAAGVSVVVQYTGASHRDMQEWLGYDLTYIPQCEGDLGVRMTGAFQGAFDAGAKRVAVMGTDCPNLRESLLKQAFALLRRGRNCIGPAADGGFYLLGLTSFKKELLQHITWSTDVVYGQTVKNCEDARMSVVPLKMLADIDSAEDIPPKISVIIPAFNEEAHIQSALASVQKGFSVESIVVDGGSGDATVDRASEMGARVVTGFSGRARQMNAGAVSARGDILLFLHADTVLPDEWDCAVRHLVHNNPRAVGAFKFSVQERLCGIGVVEWGANIRSRFLKRPYGDQGLFMMKQYFRDLGHFPKLPVMEDLFFVRRARQSGSVVTVSQKVCTSGRKWAERGVWKNTAKNQLVLLAAACGVSLDRIARFYRGRR
jgi:rSAM/selenodomain-associated transferase 2/rSAM/selenodomain-associated transferase 1